MLKRGEELRITFFFPEGEDLAPVTVEDGTPPVEGKLVFFHTDDANYSNMPNYDPRYDYNCRKWKVKEVTYSVRTHANSEKRVIYPTTYYAEVLLVRGNDE